MVGVTAWEPNVQRYLSVFGPSCPSFLLCGLTLGEEGRVKCWESPQRFLVENIFAVKSSTMEIGSKKSLDSKEAQEDEGLC